MQNKKNVSGFVALTMLTVLATAIPALADTNTPTTQPNNGVRTDGIRGGVMNRGQMKPGVFGTVSVINGNIITVNSKKGFGSNATTNTFTIDATNAKITKNNVAGTISNIVVGDTIMAQGTLTGTNLVATMIRDVQIVKGTRNGPNGDQTNKTLPVSPITGNGQPVVAGTVSSISGSIMTITNKSNVSYTVDTTNAKIVQGLNTISISNIVTGDMVIVQGAVNGNNIVASSVIDQVKKTNSTAGATTKPQNQGFFSGISSFFAHIFGF